MVIIQPTPEIERKAALGEQNEDKEVVCEVTVEEITNDITEEVVQNPDFTLDKPIPKVIEGLSIYCLIIINLRLIVNPFH